MQIRSAVRHLSLIFCLSALYCAMPAFAYKHSCAKLKAERDKAMNTLNKIQGQKLPEDKIAEVSAIVSELQQLMNSQAQDKDKKEIQDRIKQMQSLLPQSDAGIVGGINDFLKSVSEGAGVTGEQAKSVSDFLANVKDRLDTVQGFYAAGNPSGAKTQIEQFSQFLNDLAKAMGISGIPGVTDLVQAYSQGIKSIAQSAGPIESVVARDEQIYKKAGFTGDLYLHPLTRREKRDKMIHDLAGRIKDLEGQISSGECESPSRPDPCFDQNSRVARDIQQARKMVDGSETATSLKEIDTATAEQFGNLASKDPAARKQAVENYGDYTVRRRLLQQEDDQQLGDLLDTASQGWNDQDKHLMENCYPYYSSLMPGARTQKLPKLKPTPRKTTPATAKIGTKSAAQ